MASENWRVRVIAAPSADLPSSVLRGQSPVHHGQYVISPSEASPVDGWVSRPIGTQLRRLWLHSCPSLPVLQGQTNDAFPITLLGLAVQMRPDQHDPPVQISTVTAEALQLAAQGWGGRWVLVVGDELYPDASANLKVAYTQHGSGLVSSSTALLAQLTGRPAATRQIIHGIGIDWYPGPLTRADGVYRLLPGQSLNLGSLTTTARRLLAHIQTQAVVPDFAEMLVTGLRNLARQNGTIYLPLTAGIDSRTLLAGCVAADIRPITYTFEKPTITQGDRTVPPLLAAKLGFEHHYITRQHYSRARQGDFDSHCFSECMDVDRSYYSWGQWSGWAQCGIILRGGCFEFGRAFFDDDLPPAFSGSALDIQSARGPRWWALKQPLVHEGLDQWLNWAATHPVSGLDIRDRLYLEQRLGCWLSNIEQALDLTGTRRIHLANSAHLFALMNTTERDCRSSGATQKAVISYLAPSLAAFPFNPPDHVLRRVRNRLLSLPRRLRPFLFADKAPTES